VSISEAVRSVFSNYTKFSGRSSRSEFWWWFLVSTLVSLALLLISPVVTVIWELIVIVPTLAVGWRRIHDTNLAGPFYLLTYIGSIALVTTPLLGLLQIVGLVLCARRGTPGPNRFGPSPLAPSFDAEPGFSSSSCPTCGKMVLPGQSTCSTCGTSLT
jgi:uncharacterized membrane protein YhaH (DUF805 family)